MVFGTTITEQVESVTPTLKRKRPGPASKTMKRKNTSDGGESECASTSSSSQTPSAIPEVENCFLCFRQATPCKWDTEEKRNLMKNLCQSVMPKDQEGVVVEDELSFCGECQELVKRLYEADEKIQKAELEKATAISLVQTTIMEGEGRRLICPSSISQEDGWMKLRRQIVEGCRMKQQEDSDMSFHSFFSITAATSPSSQDTHEPMELDESQQNGGNISANSHADADGISMITDDSGSLNFSREEQKEIEEVVSALVEFVAGDAIRDDLKGADVSETDKKAASSSIRISFGSVLATVRHSTNKAEPALEVKKEKESSSSQSQSSVKNINDEDANGQTFISKVESVSVSDQPDKPIVMVEDKQETEKSPPEKTVFVARKSTGGYYKPQIAPTASFLVKSKAKGSSKLFDSYLNEASTSYSQESTDNSLLSDSDGTSKLVPFVLPQSPRFMLSVEKMSPAAKDIAKTIIKQLGGLISTGDQFDRDSVAVVAERLTDSEKVLCSIASGTFILKMRYLEDSRDAGRFLPIKKRHLWREKDAKQGDKKEQKLAKASYSWLIAQRQGGKKGKMFGQKFFLLPTTCLRMGVSARMIQAAGGEIVETKEEATCIIKDGPPPKKNKGIPIKNSSSLYSMIVSDPAK